MLIRQTQQFALTAALVMGVGAAYAQDMSSLAFMTGSWVENKGQNEVRETWVGPSVDVMVAVNLSTFSTSKAEFEFLRIARNEDKITYFASPGGRSPATPFPLKELTNNRVVFEDMSRDFPQRIIYRRDGDNLVARIEGQIAGRNKAKEWTFRRVQ